MREKLRVKEEAGYRESTAFKVNDQDLIQYLIVSSINFLAWRIFSGPGPSVKMLVILINILGNRQAL